MAHGGFEGESLEVWESLVGIEEGCRPHLLRVEFLNEKYVLFVVVVEVEVSSVELARVEDDEDTVVAVELTEILPVVVVVEALDVVVEPYLASSEGAGAMTFEAYALYLEFGQEIAH